MLFRCVFCAKSSAESLPLRLNGLCLIMMRLFSFAAEHRVRGVLMFELHAAVAEVARRASNRGHLDPMALRDSLLVS
jgi:hypothetical protein